MRGIKGLVLVVLGLFVIGCGDEALTPCEKLQARIVELWEQDEALQEREEEFRTGPREMSGPTSKIQPLVDERNELNEELRSLNDRMDQINCSMN